MTVFERQQYIEEVAAYIRVSTQEQKLHGISLEAQEQKLKEYAEKHNMKIVEWYKDEGVSGRKLIRNRPELQRMIHDAQKKKFKRIIFIKLDRFFRSVAEYHECMKLIDPVIWTATEEKFDLATPSGVAFVNMKLTMAQFEADQTGERIRMVNEHKIKTGQPLFGKHCLPFCFTVKKPEDDERHKTIVKQNEEAANDMILYILTKRSIRGAMTYINDKYSLNLPYGAVAKTLKNTMLYGFYRGNPNYCEPYITKEVFDEIQEIIKRNPRTSENEHCYLFTGMIRCPVCNKYFYGGPTSKWEVKNGEKKRVYLYRCTNMQIHKRCTCGKSVFENTLERQLLDKIEEIVKNKQVHAKSVRANVEKVSKHNVADLQAQLDRLNYSWQKGRIRTVEEYDRRYDELAAKINEANEELSEVEAEPDYQQILGALSSGWREMYQELGDEEKRAFWRSFIDEIVIDWSKVRKKVIDVKFLRL